MFKTEIKIVAWSEETKVYVAKQLTSLHIKYDVINEERSITEYDMCVGKKQLSDIAKYIIPMINVFVEMKLCDGSLVRLTR